MAYIPELREMAFHHQVKFIPIVKGKKSPTWRGRNWQNGEGVGIGDMNSLTDKTDWAICPHFHGLCVLDWDKVPNISKQAFQILPTTERRNLLNQQMEDFYALFPDLRQKELLRNWSQHGMHVWFWRDGTSGERHYLRNMDFFDGNNYVLIYDYQGLLSAFGAESDPMTDEESLAIREAYKKGVKPTKAAVPAPVAKPVLMQTGANTPLSDKPGSTWTENEITALFNRNTDTAWWDDRKNWLHAGMAIHDIGVHPDLYGIWCNLSMVSAKFDPVDQQKTWNGFTRGKGISMGTFVHMWRQSNRTDRSDLKQWIADNIEPDIDGRVPAGDVALAYGDLSLTKTFGRLLKENHGFINHSGVRKWRIRLAP